jgi:DNA-binding transcriptional regulator YiaG
MAQIDRYLELVRQFPLKPLHNNKDLKRATVMLHELLDIEELDQDEQDYLHVLGTLIHAYEAEHSPMESVSKNGKKLRTRTAHSSSRPKIEDAATCSACGEKVRITHDDYVWNDVDLPVILEDIELLQCVTCGNVDPVIPKLGPLMRTLAKAVIEKPYPLRGGEVRFLRKHLAKTGEEFAKLLHVDKTAISKWENDATPIGDQSDRLIRLIAAGLIENFKKADVAWTITHFPDISDDTSSKRISIDPQNMSYRYDA